MRLLIIFLFVFSFASVNDKIYYTKKTIKKTTKKISTMNYRLDKTVEEIYKAQKYLNNINKQISKLSKKIDYFQKSVENKKKSLIKLEKQRQNLLTKKQRIEQQLLDFISNNYYLKVAKIRNEEDFIKDEIIKVITKQTMSQISTILDKFDLLDEKIEKINKLIKELKDSELVLKQRKKEIALLQKTQQAKIATLKKIKRKYKKELDRFLASQNSLQRKLTQLNIIKLKEIKRKREILRQRELARQQQKNMKNIKIKKYGSISMKSKTRKYRGKKTIPPLKGKIIKRFGKFKDPVYNISFYNDSITIKAKPNSKVRAIFAGQVAFVGDTNDGKMIVINHKNKLYSIYAKLSRISPYIKKGYRVKKGEVIARVNSELEFEITYKTYPINPLDVIRF